MRGRPPAAARSWLAAVVLAGGAPPAPRTGEHPAAPPPAPPAGGGPHAPPGARPPGPAAPGGAAATAGRAEAAQQALPGAARLSPAAAALAPDPQTALDRYWTPQRMASATPVDNSVSAAAVRRRTQTSDLGQLVAEASRPS